MWKGIVDVQMTFLQIVVLVGIVAVSGMVLSAAHGP